MTPTVAFALICCVGFVFGVTFLVAGGGRKDELTARSASVDAAQLDQGVYGTFAKWFLNTRMGRTVESRMSRGDLSFDPVNYVLGSLVLAVLGMLILSRILPSLVALAAGIGILWASWLYLKRREEQRTQRFIDQLADVARILSGAAFAGLSVGSGVQIAARELSEPAASEMALVAERLAIGESLESAVDGLRERARSREVGVLISTLIIQQRTGGDAVRSLGDIAQVLEARADTLREVRNIMSPAKLVNIALPLLIVGVLLFGNVVRPGALKEAFTDLPGIVLLTAAFTLWGIGIWLVRRLGRLPDWYKDDRPEEATS